MLLLAKIHLSYPKLYKHKIQEYFEPVSWFKALLYYHIFNEDFIVFESEKEEIITKLDRTQLIRIITNLVKNAIQSIPEEQTKKMVLVSVKEEFDHVLIIVKDNGTGIESENIEHIFEPKFTTKNSGMGLGLGIIKNIIENYKGTITFETELGKGTTFTVSLPIIKK